MMHPRRRRPSPSLQMTPPWPSEGGGGEKRGVSTAWTVVGLWLKVVDPTPIFAVKKRSTKMAGSA